MIKKILRKVVGIEQVKEELEEIKQEAYEKKKEAQEEDKRIKSLREEEQKIDEKVNAPSEKEIATSREEPWVKVIDTQVNYDDIRNGFFEIDWNEYFIEQLKTAGYGAEGDPEEEIVDRWFREIVAEMLENHGYDPNQNAGYMRVAPSKQRGN